MKNQEKIKEYLIKNIENVNATEFIELTKIAKINSDLIVRNKKLRLDPDVLYHLLDVDKDCFIYFLKPAFTEKNIDKIFLNSNVTYEAIVELPWLLANVKILALILTKYENYSNEIILLALENGFVPKKNDFLDYKVLQNYEQLLDNAFKIDPSIILFYKGYKITNEMIYSSISRGFEITEQNLIENENLCSSTCVMEYMIKLNPQLIVYTGSNCYLNKNIIDEALKKYIITEDDLKNHPNILQNFSIMNKLEHLKKYNRYLPIPDKRDLILETLKAKLDISCLHFLDKKFGGKLNIDKLKELLNKLEFNLNEDMLSQDSYFIQLIDIVEQFSIMRYEKNKLNYQFSDIVSLNKYINVSFKNQLSDETSIKDLINNIYIFTEKVIEYDKISRFILKFYRIFKRQNYILLSDTSYFSNFILNIHRNNYIKKSKENISLEIKRKLNLSDKKKQLIINGLKFKKIGQMISMNNFNQLGVSKEDLNLLLEDVINNLKLNKKLIKNGVDLNKLLKLKEYFFDNGSLDIDYVLNELNTKNKKLGKFIINKFEKIKLRFVDCVVLDNNIISYLNLDRLSLNNHNYKILDSNLYFYNLANIILKLDEQSLDKILENNNSFDEILYLIPLLETCEELSYEVFINILKNYDKIKNKLNGCNLLSNLKNTIILGNTYESADNVTKLALGDKLYDSFYYQPKEYLQIFLKMLDRKTGFIPPIIFQYNDYYIESGVYSNPDRLLLGKINNNSCIDLLGAGRKTYLEVLLNNYGDVLLIYDKNNKLVSRVLIIRRGNVIQLISAANDKKSYDFYKKIADKIMFISQDDNIDYVVVNKMSILNDSTMEFIKDSNLIECFPHCDINSQAVILTSKNNNKFDFNVPPKIIYKGKRRKVITNPNSLDIIRLQALEIEMEVNESKKEEKKQNFEPFIKDNYKYCACGEDFYITVDYDNRKEKHVLPTASDETFEEIQNIEKGLVIKLKRYRL